MTKEEIIKPENLVYKKPTLMNDNPMHYCPGCSHGVVHKLIAEVIEEMGMESQVNMVTDVYSHILDDDRRKNAELFEEAFYEKKNLDPQMHVQQENNNATVADEVDPELLAKVLVNSEMRALLNSLAKTMK